MKVIEKQNGEPARRLGNIPLAARLVENSNPLESAPELHGVVNILLLGGDAGKNRWGLRPDSISVAHIDLDTGRVVMIGIPRNLQRAPFSDGSPMRGPWPKGFNCGNTCLINAIYTYATGHSYLYDDPKYAGRDPGVQAMREAFANRNEGEDRNKWLYSYNPLTVELT